MDLSALSPVDPSVDELSFDTYQMDTFNTAKYPDCGEGTALALAYVALGLAGEGGEIANKVKKILRDDNGVVSDEKRQVILAEAGDVLWYLARVVDELGGSLEVIAQANLDKLQSRKERGVLGGSGDNR